MLRKNDERFQWSIRGIRSLSNFTCLLTPSEQDVGKIFPFKTSCEDFHHLNEKVNSFHQHPHEGGQEKEMKADCNNAAYHLQIKTQPVHQKKNNNLVGTG